MAGEKWTADQVRQVLWNHYSDRYAVLFEVTARPEGSLLERLQAAKNDEERAAVRASHRERRIDALLVRRSSKAPAPVAAPPPPAAPASADGLFTLDELPAAAAVLRGDPGGDDGGLDRMALEIKVSRGDFLNDVAHPEKQAPWRAMAARHAYVVPAGLVRPEEVPAGSGLLTVSREGLGNTLKWVRTAPWREVRTPLPLPNILDLAWRAARAEALARGLTGRAGSSEEEMRAELARVRHQLELANNRHDRQAEVEAELRRQLAVAAPPPCETCGLPLLPARAGGWRHRPDDEAVCEPQRAAAEEARRRATFKNSEDPRFLRGGKYFHVPPPEPTLPELVATT